MSVTITIVVDDTGTAVSAQAAGAPGVVAASHGQAETDAAPPTLLGGLESGTGGGLSGGADDRPPLEPAALGLGTDTGHGGGPAPADLLVKPDESDTDEGGGKPMPLEALGEASESTGRRSARGK